MTKKWQEAQTWESDWWANCLNTYGEEEKQLLYAAKMGLSFWHDKKSPYNIDIGKKSILDIGGGPASLLLKATGGGSKRVLDPLPMPAWVQARYEAAGIELLSEPGESIPEGRAPFDEVWIYNCLQHTKKPRDVVRNALNNGRLIRVFEWLNTVENVGHPHVLTQVKLDRWLGGEGKVEDLEGQAHCWGTCYYGVFPGN